MTSTSASSIQRSYKYDVFLSFRGEDTRTSFVDHLYHALEQKSIDTYRDDEMIKKGERIGEQLLKSIEESRFYIIVFSKNYTSSSWCLNELVKIIECQKTREHTAYPVFYDVEPNEIRKQNGVVGKAFAKHIEDKYAGKWQEALREAANLAGWELKNTFDGHEAMLIKEIVKQISQELRYIDLSVDAKLTGMEKRVRDVVSSLETRIDDVRMIGIKGIGGGGKTTLAKAVFNQIYDLYDGSSFVENVRESTKDRGLKSLQKKVLSDVLNDPNIVVGGVPDLKSMMKKKMRSRKVLIVLDDVDHIDQLEALAGETNWFKPGSRVIITTRDKQVLATHRVPENLILNVNLLSHEEATCLFNRYAFGSDSPNHGFEMLSEQFVSYAHGLPLTIKVLGAFLCSKDELVWTDALERLDEIPLDETLKILELSYDSLEKDHKEIFLDVACVLIGWKKEKAIRVLESCGFYARTGLNVLEQKSLVAVSDEGRLSMHDHIEELGENIIRRLHPNEPYNHSRLWIEEEIEDILYEDKGTEETRYISVGKVDPIILMKGLRKMKELRFLKVDSIIASLFMRHPVYNCTYEDIGEDSLYLPDSLQYLTWKGYPFRCLPESFQANNLVGLKICAGKINQLWEGREKKGLKKLRFVDLHRCEFRTLDIRLFLNLERLNLKRCNKLVELLMPVESFRLKFLSLSCCLQLKTLDLSRAQNLNTLDIADCKGLVEIQMPIKNIDLKHLKLKSSKLKTLNLKLALNLKNLDVDDCEDLEELLMPVESVKLECLDLCVTALKTLDLSGAHNLVSLNIEGCKNLVKLQMPVKLKYVKLCDSNMRTIDLSGAQGLLSLIVKGCKYLVDLHMPVELECLELRDTKLTTLDLSKALNLISLNVEKCQHLVKLDIPVENVKLKSLNLCHSKVRKLDLSGALNLISLNIEKCQHLAELDIPVENVKLESVKLCHSNVRRLDLSGALSLVSLNVENCRYLVKLDIPVETVKLESVKLCRSNVRRLDLSGALNLINLNVEKCRHLVELDIPSENVKLKSVKLYHSDVRRLDLSGTLNLISLNVEKCPRLVKLGIPVENVKLESVKLCDSNVRRLDLSGALNLINLNVEKCQHLVELDIHVENVKLGSIKLCHSSVRRLDLSGALNLISVNVEMCRHLVKLDIPVENVKLESVKLRHTKLRTLDLSGAQSLVSLDVEECQNLVKLDIPVENVQLQSLELWNTNVRRLDLSGAQNLMSLIVYACENLVELDIPIEKAQLESIKLWDTNVRRLDLSGAQNLNYLRVRECENLVELDMPVENVTLESVKLRDTNIGALNLVGAQNLRRLKVEGCKNLVELHMPAEHVMLKSVELRNTKLRTLDLSGARNLINLNVERCENLVELRIPVENAMLESVSLFHSNMRTLVLSRAHNISSCESLVESNISQSQALDKVDLGSDELKTLNLRSVVNLQHLYLRCHNLAEIRAPIKYLKDYVEIATLGFYCDRLNPVLVNQGSPMLLAELHLTVSPSYTFCLSHPHNDKLRLEYRCIYKEPLSSIRSAEKVIYVKLRTCANSASFWGNSHDLSYFKTLTLERVILVPEELDQLECLEKLSLVKLEIEHLPDSVCSLKHLKSLEFNTCSLLKQLPEDLGRLVCLEKLILNHCESLQDIPNSICEMKHLNYLYLKGCNLVDKLPKEIGSLKCLENLDIVGTSIRELPHGIYQLKGLHITASKGRLRSYGDKSVLKFSKYRMLYPYNPTDVDYATVKIGSEMLLFQKMEEMKRRVKLLLQGGNGVGDATENREVNRLKDISGFTLIRENVLSRRIWRWGYD